MCSQALPKGLVLPVVLLAMFGAIPVYAFNPVEESARWEIPRLGAPSQALREYHRVSKPGMKLLGAPVPPAALMAFADRNGGNWHYMINDATGTLHHVYGSGVDLARHVDAAQAAEEVAREFMRANPALFAVTGSDLDVMSSTYGLGKWSVIFQETFQGLRVWGGRAHVVFTRAGRLFAFGSDIYPGIDISTSPRFSEQGALSIAKRDLGFVDGVDTVDYRELMILPVETDGRRLDYRLAYRFDLSMNDPFGMWATWVDANSGEILWRENHIRFIDFTGNTRGDVEWDSYCDGYTPDCPLGNMRMSISGVGTCYSDGSGDFTLAYGGNDPKALSAGFDGYWVDVDRFTGVDANHTGTITPGTPYTIVWNNSNSLDSERDVFAFVNNEHDWLNAMDPAWTGVDYEMTATVERTDGYCPGNAWWDGSGINFCVQSYDYGNTGRMADVVYHEYGHAITDFLYGPNDPPGDMHEGNSDIVANLLTKESIIGLGYYIGNCSSGIRNSDNSLQYPCTGSSHYCGQVIAGFHWDSWEELLGAYGRGYADSVVSYTWHYGRKLGLPQAQPDQVYWTFVADDDDGNLDNGTPHYDQFCIGATNHGFACPEITTGVFITHTPYEDTQNTSAPYEIVAEIISTVGAIEASTCRLTFRTNGGAFSDSTMRVEGGNPDEYTGRIPAQGSCTNVEYYIYAEDVIGNHSVHPTGAPSVLHSFGVGYEVVLDDDFETDRGWTAGLPGDDATTGQWERCDPDGTPAQAEDDHTSDPGANAYITGCAAGTGEGSYDIDGGKTTLESPVFDLSGYTRASVVYHRWYSNDTGAEPGTDYWVVRVTDDGWATYAELENTNLSDRTWKKMEFDLASCISLADQVQCRFIASHESPPSLVEAGVDDFSLTGCESGGDTEAPSVTVLTPNGGELLIAGDDIPYEIAWQSSDNAGVVMTHILLSVDGGYTYPDTLASADLDSTYDWLVPTHYESETCRIEVVCADAVGNEGCDESDTDFRILRHVGARDPQLLPAAVVLMQNRPSPFGGSTVIEFGLPETQEISLELYDVKGRLVTSLAKGLYKAGYHEVLWNGVDASGTGLSPGVYFYRLVTGCNVLTRKLLVVK